MNDTHFTGPLDALDRYDKNVKIVGMFQGSTGPLTMKEWSEVLDSRRELIKDAKKSILQPRLGNVTISQIGRQTLYYDKPEANDGVLKLRGTYFVEAFSRLAGQREIRFVGIDSDGDWLLVTVHFTTNRERLPGPISTATSVSAQKCVVADIIKAGIDPLDLFRWMNNWVISLRNHRAKMLMRAYQLETLFAAQDMHVSTRVGFDKYCKHELAETPKD